MGRGRRGQSIRSATRDRRARPIRPKSIDPARSGMSCLSRRQRSQPCPPPARAPRARARTVWRGPSLAPCVSLRACQRLTCAQGQASPAHRACPLPPASLADNDLRTTSNLRVSPSPAARQPSRKRCINTGPSRASPTTPTPARQRRTGAPPARRGRVGGGGPISPRLYPQTRPKLRGLASGSGVILAKA